MKHIKVLLHTLVKAKVRGIFSEFPYKTYKSFASHTSNTIVNFLAKAIASVARNLTGIHFLTKGTIKIVNFFAPAIASVARNLKGALPLLKGTIK